MGACSPRPGPQHPEVVVRGRDAPVRAPARGRLAPASWVWTGWLQLPLRPAPHCRPTTTTETLPPSGAKAVHWVVPPASTSAKWGRLVPLFHMLVNVVWL